MPASALFCMSASSPVDTYANEGRRSRGYECDDGKGIGRARVRVGVCMCVHGCACVCMCVHVWLCVCAFGRRPLERRR